MKKLFNRLKNLWRLSEYPIDKLPEIVYNESKEKVKFCEPITDKEKFKKSETLDEFLKKL